MPIKAKAKLSSNETMSRNNGQNMAGTNRGCHHHHQQQQHISISAYQHISISAYQHISIIVVVAIAVAVVAVAVVIPCVNNHPRLLGEYPPFRDLPAKSRCFLEFQEGSSW